MAESQRFWDDTTGRPSSLQQRVLQLYRMGYSWSAAKETAWLEEIAAKRADELLKGA